MHYCVVRYCNLELFHPRSNPICLVIVICVVKRKKRGGGSDDNSRKSVEMRAPDSLKYSESATSYDILPITSGNCSFCCMKRCITMFLSGSADLSPYGNISKISYERFRARTYCIVFASYQHVPCSTKTASPTMRRTPTRRRSWRRAPKSASTRFSRRRRTAPSSRRTTANCRAIRRWAKLDSTNTNRKHRHNCRKINSIYCKFGAHFCSCVDNVFDTVQPKFETHE